MSNIIRNASSNLKHIWDARAHILDHMPVPFFSAFAGAAAGWALGGTSGMYTGSVLSTFVATRVEDQLRKRHQAEYNYFNSDDPVHRHDENGRIIARLSSAVAVPAMVHLASTLN